MNDALVLALLLVGAGLAAVGVALVVVVRRLILSIECLCSNVGALREQMAHGGQHG